MTDQEWLAGSDPQPMLEFLLDGCLGNAVNMQEVAAIAMRRRSGRGRKFRLYALGWSRLFLDATQDDRLRHAVDVAERYSDGLANANELRAATRHARDALSQARRTKGPDGWRPNVAHFVLNTVSLRFLPGWNPHWDWQSSERKRQDTMQAQCTLLRDIFTNPLRAVPTIDPAWQSWNDSASKRLAEAIYDERAFDRLPVLADALQEAGCTDEEILGHCRQGNAVHVRGC